MGHNEFFYPVQTTNCVTCILCVTIPRLALHVVSLWKNYFLENTEGIQNTERISTLCRCKKSLFHLIFTEHVHCWGAFGKERNKIEVLRCCRIK